MNCKKKIKVETTGFINLLYEYKEEEIFSLKLYERYEREYKAVKTLLVAVNFMYYEWCCPRRFNSMYS